MTGLRFYRHRISCIKFWFLLTGTGFINFQSGFGKTGTGFSDFQSGSGSTGIKKKTGIPVAQPDFYKVPVSFIDHKPRLKVLRLYVLYTGCSKKRGIRECRCVCSTAQLLWSLKFSYPIHLKIDIQKNPVVLPEFRFSS